MNLPNYFLADLPPEAPLQPNLIREACLTLKKNREQYLQPRSTRQIIQVLSELGRSWLQADYPFRAFALKIGPATLGFSEQTLAGGLDAFFSQLTPESLHGLLVQDLGHGGRLDDLTATSPEQQTRRAAWARGPDLLAHITAGNLPPPALASMISGLLLRSAQFVKCPAGTALLPRLFAHSLYEAEPKLGSCLEVVEWSRDRAELEETLLTEADGITVTGTDEAVEAIRRRAPSRARVIAYGHRVSFAYIARDVLSRFNLTGLVNQAVDDIIAWNQLGCLSPHLFYVEQGGVIAPEQFAEKLAEALEQKEQSHPRGAISLENAALIASRRAFYKVRAAHSLETKQWASTDSTSWTVIYEADPRFQISCLHRFVYVKGVTGLTAALCGADAIRQHVSTVGLAAGPEQAAELARELATWGARRICPLGQMQKPPLSWRHDGRPALADLVTWTDWEQG